MESQAQRDRRLAGLLVQERLSWIAHWRELEGNFMPRKGRWLTTDANRGDRRNRSLINDAPIIAARIFTAGMMSGTTSASRPWFRLSLADPELMEAEGVRVWLWIVEDRLREIFAKSNFYQVMPALYRDLGVIGTGLVLVEEDDEDVARFTHAPVGTYCIANGRRGMADTLYRELTWTVRLVVEQFGPDACSDATKAAYKDKNRWEQKVEICHLVTPNTGRDSRYIDAKNMAFRSVWWEKSEPEKYLLESGFEEFPALAPRWETVGEDAYGQSPAMDCLGDAKALQVQEKRIAQGIDKFIDPPMRASSRIDRNAASIAAGSMTVIDETVGGVGFEPAVTIDPRGIQFAAEDVARMEMRIQRAMYADLFRMLDSLDDRDRTAEEIRAREAERITAIAPNIERQSREVLDPVVSLVFRLAARQGRIPPPPPALEGTEMRVEYIGVLAQAQKSLATQTIERTVAFVGALAQAQANAGLPPDAMDKLDIDQAFDEHSTALGTPPTIVRSDETVAQIRERRQQMADAQQNAAVAEQATAAVRNIGQAAAAVS
jgi:hypothetical protein